MDNILLIVALALFISATFVIKSAKEKLKMSKSLLNQTMREYIKVLTLYRDLLSVCKHEDLHKLIGPQNSQNWIYK